MWVTGVFSPGEHSQLPAYFLYTLTLVMAPGALKYLRQERPATLLSNTRINNITIHVDTLQVHCKHNLCISRMSQRPFRYTYCNSNGILFPQVLKHSTLNLKGNRILGGHRVRLVNDYEDIVSAQSTSICGHLFSVVNTYAITPGPHSQQLRQHGVPT